MPGCCSPPRWRCWAPGLFLAHGLLIATGLVLAGIVADLLDPHRRGRPDRHPPPRSWPR
ncbi:hypothetical protein NGM36_25490 [Streptomyces mutabilis]|uniref:hypothetical protein n=1 Tax=Streptomyces mutabilis TaxID=67332 RepID=UPI0022BA4896|nr:hypothetical protein [Streptomyces mutabilis]MCZ9353082.1 hypothetical protein [Streptomyces mutabilis]